MALREGFKLREGMVVGSAGQRRMPGHSSVDGGGGGGEDSSDENNDDVTGRSADTYSHTTRRTTFLSGLHNNPSTVANGSKDVKTKTGLKPTAASVKALKGPAESNLVSTQQVRVRNKHGKVVDAVPPTLHNETEEDAVKRKLKQQYKELEKNKQLQKWLEEKAAK